MQMKPRVQTLHYDAESDFKVSQTGAVFFEDFFAGFMGGVFPFLFTFPLSKV